MASFRDRWKYEHGDPSIKLWDFAVQRGWIELPEGASVLELGCCETDWSHWMAKAGVGCIGVDVNRCDTYCGPFVQADASSHEFASDVSGYEAAWTQLFDAVVLLGSLEHFGLGFYGDPLKENGDIQTMQNVARWLKPGGFCFVDVPWTPESYYITENRHFRVYDDKALAERITPAGLVVEQQAWAAEANPPIGLIDTRPESPMSPFWYTVRVLRKPA